MSISDEISRLSGNISDSFGAVEDMGGTVPQNTNSDNLAAAIRSIPQPDTVTPESIAIVANGNTHAAIASENYAYVRNHSSLAEGLYQATTAIAANATLSSSNLVAVSSGGLNALNSNINTHGYIITGDKNTATVAVPNNTGTLISSIVLTKGVWVVVGCADWGSNENGYRQIAFSDAVNPARNSASTTSGINGKETYQQITLIRATNGETINMYARQTSGGNLNVYPFLYATKVGTNGYLL